MMWLYLVFAALCLLAAGAHFTDHYRHHVPGLLFVSITMLLEGLEYAWIFMFWNDLSIVYAKNIITITRIVLVIGFLLGVRYGNRELRTVRRPDHAIALAGEGYAGLFDRLLRRPWLFFKAGYRRVRSWHDQEN